MTVESDFLQFSTDKLLQLMSRIETCTAHLTPQQIWMRHSESENAVGNLLMHLNGNLRQWILHGIGGQPNDRDRDGEFAARGETASAERVAELVGRLRATVEEVAAVLRALPALRLIERQSTQGYETTVLGAIYHVVEHFAGHTFQIILLTKFFTGRDLEFYAHLKGAKAVPDPLP